jgi:protein-arginine deiminase
MRHSRVLVAGLAAATLAACAAPGCGGDDGSPAAAEPPSGVAGVAGSDAADSASAPEAASDGPGETADTSPPAPVVDLRADVNRNGTVDLEDPTEDASEDTWDKTHGAVFLANIDDDTHRCPKTGTDLELAACNDATDEVVNGDDDLRDLARLRTRPWPEAPDDASGAIALGAQAASHVRLFKKQAGGFQLFDPSATRLTPADLRTGVELAVEGKDIVRDRTAWDGYVDVTLEVKAGTAPGGVKLPDGKDTVRLRLAPVVLAHQLLAVEAAYDTLAWGSDSEVFRTDFKAAASAAGVPGGVVELDGVPEDDQWTQDLFEIGVMSMPAAGGQHAIRVAFRSANVYDPASATNPLRAGGRIVFTMLRGKDVAAVQEFDPKHDQDMDTLDSLGNTETIPPYSKDGVDYPLGRLFRGSTPAFHPDPRFSTMLESQALQPPVYVDTSWLLIGHVDEAFTFVKGKSAPGWVLLVADPALARKMLEDQVAAGNGGVKMFAGKNWLDDNDVEYPAEATIAAVLADADIMAASAAAAAKIDTQLQALRNETGITDGSIVRVPFLFWNAYGYAVAYQPDTVNGTVLSDSHYAAPDPHGPVIGGKDIFKTQLEQALAPLGIGVDWVEDWDLYHRLEGEVHCGSNVRRAPPSVRWWETGR